MNNDDDLMSLGDGGEVVGDGVEMEGIVYETLGVPPSANEIRLGRKVLDLEKERDGLAAELARLRTRYPDHSTTIPVPDDATIITSAQPITIPHELLPTLDLLRHHIAELTRDNHALRYTFLGEGEASSSQVTHDTPIPAQPGNGTGGVDLKAVVKRVKAVMRENEELGEMILEAGKGSGPEWQKAIDDSKAVIQSLESDLAHHLSVVQSVRSELVAYKTHFGPIPKPGDKPTSIISPTPPASLIVPTPSAPKLSRAGSISTSSSARHDRRRDSDRHRDKDRDKAPDRSDNQRHGERRRGGENAEPKSGQRAVTGDEISRGVRKENDRDRDFKRRR